MSQPPGFVDPTRLEHVCLLKRSLYGLKQAPQIWNNYLTVALLSLGFFKTDRSLFFKYTGEKKLFCPIYVDDILLMGSDSALVQSLITQLQNKFAVRDLRNPHTFWAPKCMDECWVAFATREISGVQMDSCSNVSTGASPSTKLSFTKGSQFNDSTLYLSVVGAL
ncbi:retrovirus-related pol polyprotein from transposon tnt 1-94 [Nicotiana attenuata]|uniref:Retrovirus-related pol polyprotein from transposon tnt 1-94 n=1 Tax=Nicotiana attenuata TaxID=49451 RepID=A0A314LFL5_NICAT|nr:retrovirus-related pol polyprotein from transposon tnt 1-94 [Nicotiana attenuata]